MSAADAVLPAASLPEANPANHEDTTESTTDEPPSRQDVHPSPGVDVRRPGVEPHPDDVDEFYTWAIQYGRPFALKLSLDYDTADDLTQRAIITIRNRLESNPSFRPKKSWRGFLRALIRHEFEHEGRTWAREQTRAERYMERWQLIEREWLEAGTQLDLAELEGVLRAVVSAMPAKRRAMYLAVQHGGRKPKDIARELGIETHSVNTQIARAKAELIAAVRAYLDGTRTAQQPKASSRAPRRSQRRESNQSNQSNQSNKRQGLVGRLFKGRRERKSEDI